MPEKPTVASGAVDAFLRLRPAAGPEIKGESEDSKYRDWIEVLSYEFQADNPTTIGSSSGGAGAGKASFRPLKIVKRVDRASPLLFHHCCMGSHIDEVQLTIRKAGGTALDYLIYRARTVFLTSFKHLGMVDAMNPIPFEEITLVCGAIQVEYTPQTQAGGGSAPVIAAWSVIKNINKFEGAKG